MIKLALNLNFPWGKQCTEGTVPSGDLRIGVMNE